jgi:hypothetical protein
VNPKVYVESSVLSYLTSRFSRDLLVAANQQITRQWWENGRARFHLYTSQYVLDEISVGNAAAAAHRMAAATEMTVLSTNDGVIVLAQSLLNAGALPKKAVVDALHVAVAATHKMDYLLTWNCKHIANPAMRPKIEKVCREMNLTPPIICTPEELMEV